MRKPLAFFTRIGMTCTPFLFDVIVECLFLLLVELAGVSCDSAEIFMFVFGLPFTRRGTFLSSALFNAFKCGLLVFTDFTDFFLLLVELSGFSKAVEILLFLPGLPFKKKKINEYLFLSDGIKLNINRPPKIYRKKNKTSEYKHSKSRGISLWFK